MVKVIGIEHRKYKSKSTGRNVEGYNVYVSENFSASADADGVRAFSEWLSVDKFRECGLSVGAEGIFTYNRYGKVESFICAG